MPKTEKQKKMPEFDQALISAAGDSALSAVSKAGSSAEALIAAWVQAGNAAAVNEIAERGEGGARKAARRGINVLKSRGIAIPARPTIATVTGPAQSETWEAWMFAPDSQGTVLVALAGRTPTSRLRCAFVFLSETVGVRRIDNMELSQSQLRETLGNALSGADYKPVKVSIEYARHRIAAARQRQKERGLLEPLGLGSAKSLLEPVPA